jgi:hypothetical protein
MVNAKESKMSLERLAVPLKAAVLVAVVGFIVLAVESPHRTASPNMQNQVAQPQNVTAVSTRASIVLTADNLPGQLPASMGDANASTPSFWLCGGC